MSTVSDMVQNALDLLAILPEGETPTAAQMSTGIAALNAMARRWEANLCPQGWVDVTNPSETMPIPDESIEGFWYGLAIRLAPRYGVEPSRLVIVGAEKFLNDMRRDVAVASPIIPVVDIPLPDAYYGANSLGFGTYGGG